MALDSPPTALERLIREGSEADLRRFLLLLQPPEIADIIEALESPEDRMVAHTGYLTLARAPCESEAGGHGPTAELACLSRDDLLTRFTKLTRGLMVAKARRRRRRHVPIQYH